MQYVAEQTESEPRNRHERHAKAHGRLAYPIDDFAEAVGVGRSKIYEEIRAGRLHAKKLGSRTLITAQAASDYLSQLPDFHAGQMQNPAGRTTGFKQSRPSPSDGI
jgi:excisionase family DNA binding protein